MVSRRHALRIAGGALAGLSGLAGCLDPAESTARDPSPTATDGPTEGPTERTSEPTTTTDESSKLPGWSPSWTLPIPEKHVLGLDPAGDLLVATSSAEGGPSAVAALDPVAREVVWRAEFEGEAVGGSDAGHRSIARDGWGVTVTGERVLAVTGRADSYDWTAVRAVDRASGEREWSLRKERRLAVRGVAGGTVFVTGLEFFEPDSAHDAPEEPLTSVLYAVDVDSGSVGWSGEFAGVEGVAVGDDGVYVAAGDELLAFGLDGTRRWTFEGDAAPWSVHAANDRIFFLDEDDRRQSTVYGLSRGGEPAWEKRLPIREVLLDGDRLYGGGRSPLSIESDGSVAWRHQGGYGKWLMLSPDGETLYTRSGAGGDRARAYRADDGDVRWTYEPPDLSSPNAWPVAATDEVAVVEGITGGRSSGPFTTLYAVRDGEGTKALPTEPVFDVVGLDGTVFVAGESVVALDP